MNQTTLFFLIATETMLVIGWLMTILAMRHLIKASRANTSAILLLLSIAPMMIAARQREPMS
jgi:hypothetical protein